MRHRIVERLGGGESRRTTIKIVMEESRAMTTLMWRLLGETEKQRETRGRGSDTWYLKHEVEDEGVDHSAIFRGYPLG